MLFLLGLFNLCCGMCQLVSLVFSEIGIVLSVLDIGQFCLVLLVMVWNCVVLIFGIIVLIFSVICDNCGLFFIDRLILVLVFSEVGMKLVLVSLVDSVIVKQLVCVVVISFLGLVFFLLLKWLLKVQWVWFMSLFCGVFNCFLFVLRLFFQCVVVCCEMFIVSFFWDEWQVQFRLVGVSVVLGWRWCGFWCVVVGCMCYVFYIWRLFLRYFLQVCSVLIVSIGKLGVCIVLCFQGMC